MNRAAATDHVEPVEVAAGRVTLRGDLGAESIDFLDMIFRIEDLVGKRIPTSRWYEFLEERFPGASFARAITTAVVVEFAERERNREAR